MEIEEQKKFNNQPQFSDMRSGISSVVSGMETPYEVDIRKNVGGKKQEKELVDTGKQPYQVLEMIEVILFIFR